MEHTSFCTWASWVCSGNSNISGIHGSGSRYGVAGRLLWITTRPVTAAATRHHPFAYVCVRAPSVCALCPFSNATKGQKAIHQSGAAPHPQHFPYTHRRRCPSPTVLKSNSSGWIIKSLVVLIQDAHLCTSCARAVQSGALRPGAPVSKRLSCAQTACRLKLMLCVSLLCRNRCRASLCRWWNHYILLKSCKLNPLLQNTRVHFEARIWLNK